MLLSALVLYINIIFRVFVTGVCIEYLFKKRFMIILCYNLKYHQRDNRQQRGYIHEAQIITGFAYDHNGGAHRLRQRDLR
jgi:hypothetical protein